MSANGTITWEAFREGMNSWEWRMVDREDLEELVNDFFAQAQRAKMQGKDAECKDLTTKALRLQGSLTKTKPIERNKAEDTGFSTRNDTFNVYVHRLKDGIHPDEAFGDCKEDRTLHHTFKV